MSKPEREARVKQSEVQRKMEVESEGGAQSQCCCITYAKKPIIYI